MKTIKLNIVEDWNDITLNQYKRLLKIQTETEIVNELDLYQMRLQQLHILNPDIELDDLRRLSLDQLTRAFKEIEFLDVEPVKNNQKIITIDGTKYTFNHFKNMSLEQWIDAEKFSDLENAHKLIAIFYLSADEYTNEKMELIADWLDNQPAHVAFWTISQFFFIQKASELAISLYSEQMIQKAEKIERVIHWSKKIDAVLKRFGSKFSMTSRNTTSRK